jgi:hypothetical protein
MEAKDHQVGYHGPRSGNNTEHQEHTQAYKNREQPASSVMVWDIFPAIAFV